MIASAADHAPWESEPKSDPREQAWDEAAAAYRAFYAAAYSPTVAARAALAMLPKNPYRRHRSDRAEQ